MSNLHNEVGGFEVDDLFNVKKEKDESEEDIITPVKLKHVLELIGIDKSFVLMSQIVGELLNTHGIEVETQEQSSRGRAKSRGKGPGINAKVNSISENLVEVELLNGLKVNVPFWMNELCNFFRQDENRMKVVGIFRMNGSAVRKEAIVKRLQGNEGLTENDENPFDIANTLKQFLREMAIPIIPMDKHEIFLRCLELTDKKDMIENILIAVCLLPLPNLQALCFLIEFLAEVSQYQEWNKMGPKNLAIVLGPNVMPHKIDEKKKAQLNPKQEALIQSKLTEVVEILIECGKFVGCITKRLENKLELLNGQFYSEDELENDSGVRKKKRRSASLTRFFGRLRKGTKTSDTPAKSLMMTPNNAYNTPIIKSSLTRNQQIKIMKSNDNGVDTTDNPKSYIACRSPAICLDPSPMKSEWKTPKPKHKIFTPSSLLTRRKYSSDDGLDDKASASVPSKSFKNKVFGRKAGKKQALLMQQAERFVADLEAKKAQLRPNLSIRPLNKSPRDGQVSSSKSFTKIPGPEVPVYSLRKETSSSSLSKEGDYVQISPRAVIDDTPNNAFIASFVSIENSIDSPNIPVSQEIRLSPLIHEINNLTNKAISFDRKTPERRNSRGSPSKIPRLLSLERMTSFKTQKSLVNVEKELEKSIKESRLIQIRADKRGNAEVKRRFSVQERGVASPSQRRILARRRSAEVTRPKKYSDYNYQSQASSTRSSFEQNNDLKIISKKLEINYLTPKKSPMPLPSPSTVSTPMSPRTGKSGLAETPNPTPCASNTDSIRRTLRRGRPNSIRAGLPRPSPVPTPERPTTLSRSLRRTRNFLFKSPSEETLISKFNTLRPIKIATPLRRQSSVQELVKLLENKKSSIFPDFRISSLCKDDGKAKDELGNKNGEAGLKKEILLEKKVEKLAAVAPLVMKDDFIFPTPTPSRKARKPSPVVQKEVEWVSGNEFNFTTPLSINSQKASRESIQVIKKTRAGIVSSNVEYFNQMTKSPIKSLIPLPINGYGTLRIKVSHSIERGAVGRRSKRDLDRRFSSVEILKAKNELMLENIKLESKVKRNATTTGVSSANLRRRYNYKNENNENIPMGAPLIRKKSSKKKLTASGHPNTIEEEKTPTRPPKPAKPPRANLPVGKKIEPEGKIVKEKLLSPPPRPPLSHRSLASTAASPRLTPRTPRTNVTPNMQKYFTPRDGETPRKKILKSPRMGTKMYPITPLKALPIQDVHQMDRYDN